MNHEAYLLPLHEEDDRKRMTPEEIVDRYFSEEDMAHMLLCSDFDQTMVIEDAGIQVFAQTLRTPGFWKDQPEDFKKLLLPIRYKKLLDTGAKGKDEELDQDKCQFAIDLAKDIGALYREIQRIRPGDTIEAGEDPMISEFALKMILLDQVMMDLDRIFGKRLNGEFLLRTRFFRHRSIQDIKDITSQICRQMGDTINLEVSPDYHIDGVRKLITHDNPLATARTISARPHVDTRVLETIKTMVEPEQGAIPRVVTTNHPAIPRTIIRRSAWSEVLENRDKFRLSDRMPLVRGTKLAINPSRQIVKAKAEEKPVNGNQKAVLAEEIGRNLRRRLRVAIGDSLGDFAMGRKAVLNNGIFILVPEGGMTPENPGESIEKLRRRFHSRLAESGMTENERIMMLLPNNL